jgi:hypothetical protein
MPQRGAQLKAAIAQLVEHAEAQDDAEDQEYGVDSDGDSVSEELARREARLARMRALRERLDAEQRALTTPRRQPMPTGGIIVAAELTNLAPGSWLLAPGSWLQMRATCHRSLSRSVGCVR